MMSVAPVFVTVEAPRTAKLRAVPIGGAVCAHALLRQHDESSRIAAIQSGKERLPQTMVLHSPSIHEFHEAGRSLAVPWTALISLRPQGVSGSSPRRYRQCWRVTSLILNRAEGDYSESERAWLYTRLSRAVFTIQIGSAGRDCFQKPIP